MQIFLTDRSDMGKTTACFKLIELLHKQGVWCGGVVSHEIREKETRTGFGFVDVETGKTFMLA